MTDRLPHLMVAPIVLPLLTAVLLLLLGERRRAKALVSAGSSALGFLVAIALLYSVRSNGAAGAVGIYLPSNWDVPFGIVLAVDRLSALMLVLSGIIGFCCVLFSLARWHRAGVHFHPLLQIQLMGLNGAFLTGDVFNLFVFYEVLLAASYGLLLHGSGRARVQSGLHYIAVNLVASSLFLVGAALLYGVTGTLNMADLALKVPHVAQADRGLLHAGAAILAMAFFDQSCHVAAQLLARARLHCGERASGGVVRYHDQGRRLHGAASMDIALFGACRGFRAVRRRRPDLWRARHNRFRYIRLARNSAPGPAGELQHRSVRRHAAGGNRVRASNAYRGRTVLPGELDARRKRSVPPGRARRVLSPGSRSRVGGRSRRGAGPARTAANRT